jgi:hypothetical protein
MMREKFTNEEWRLVAHIPFDAFYFGAMADGKAEESEVKAFVDSLERPGALKDPLHREIMLDHAAGGMPRVAEEMHFETSETATAKQARFARTKGMLKQKLSPAEYQAFFKSVWISAMAVAAASAEKKKRGPIWKPKPKDEPISDKEAMALATFAATWDIDLGFLKEAHHTV